MPSPLSPHFDLSLELDGVTYLLELRWNSRADAWFLMLYTAEGDLVLGSRKVVTDFPLWGRCRDARRPKGQLLAVDTAGEQLDAGLEDLGGRVQLLYFTAAELGA
jgi:hypothetical protein